MRIATATFIVALLSITLPAAGAQAAPAEVNVRIEGRTETLFEGPILTEGHNVRASSDTKAPAAGRRCNGLNNGQNPTPGPTPTAASVDAMSIVGEDFDGLWYPEPFEDYFIKRWGPDTQNEGNGEFWGLLVNNVFTDVGGCQYELDAGDEVLWVYDAFKGKPLLALFPADYTGGARPLTAVAELNHPFDVEVDAYEDDDESTPPASPQRTGANPFEGAEVAQVETNAKGFEKVNVDDPDTVVTGADGQASVTFDEPGWYRLKATRIGSGGKEDVIRSNRLDVCVPESLATDCPPLAEDQVRTPPPIEAEEPEPEEPEAGKPEIGTGGPGSAAKSAAAGASPMADPGQVHLRLPRVDRSRVARGLVKVSWRVLDAGAGLEGWTISSKTLGRKGASYVTRARGKSGTSALLRLPPGAVYRLRITITDALGRCSTAAIGKVQVPA
ncbi:MAG TPA: DUF4430 domain-containing protein [Solirubrobacterales bacterium]|nr:DUF4430 domain-containing protein [Solirubrobacterales bacterium]